MQNNNLGFLLYEGKIDEERRYDDHDTRFGIAEFSDRFCSEIFGASIEQSIDKEKIANMGEKLEKDKENDFTSQLRSHLPKGLECELNKGIITITNTIPDHKIEITYNPDTKETTVTHQNKKVDIQELEATHKPTALFFTYDAAKAVLTQDKNPSNIDLYAYIRKTNNKEHIH